MATVIRAEISEKNKYWIDKHRHYELKHFCLQYPVWKRTYSALLDLGIAASSLNGMPSGSNEPSDLTAKYAIRKAHYSNKIKMVEQAAIEADEYLWHYILRGVTEGLSYTYLKSQLDMPCSKDTYYDRYRKFFWLLSEARN